MTYELLIGLRYTRAQPREGSLSAAAASSFQLGAARENTVNLALGSSGLRIPWAGSRNPPERRRARKSPALPGLARGGLDLWNIHNRVRSGGLRAPGASEDRKPVEPGQHRRPKIGPAAGNRGAGQKAGRTAEPASRAVREKRESYPPRALVAAAPGLPRGAGGGRSGSRLPDGS